MNNDRARGKKKPTYGFHVSRNLWPYISSPKYSNATLFVPILFLSLSLSLTQADIQDDWEKEREKKTKKRASSPYINCGFSLSLSHKKNHRHLIWSYRPLFSLLSPTWQRAERFLSSFPPRHQFHDIWTAGYRSSYHSILWSRSHLLFPDFDVLCIYLYIKAKCVPKCNIRK